MNKLSEGELKKRIAEILYIPEGKFGKVYTLKDLFDVLDEAAKEFPKKQPVVAGQIIENNEIQGDTAVGIEISNKVYFDYDIDEILQWFEKWFPH